MFQSRYSVESLTQDIVSLRGKLKAVSDQMENADESFNHQMAAFLHVCNYNHSVYITRIRMNKS